MRFYTMKVLAGVSQLYGLQMARIRAAGQNHDAESGQNAPPATEPPRQVSTRAEIAEMIERQRRILEENDAKFGQLI